MNLIIASNNKGKLAQLKAWLPYGIAAKSMAEAGFTEIIPEPFDTFHQNARIKAQSVFDFCRQPVLSDDSGICVNALDGAPGVYSALYAGEGASDAENNAKLLAALKGMESRKAHYLAVLCLITHEGTHYFEGRCDGTIAESPKGDGGFGYDPLFIPDGYDQSFAELPSEIKSRISHRAKALDALAAFLQSGTGAALLANNA